MDEGLPTLQISFDPAVHRLIVRDRQTALHSPRGDGEIFGFVAKVSKCGLEPDP